MNSAMRRRSKSLAAPGSTLHPHEWDFRTVGSNDLITAILFEYTRSSSTARKAIEHWHGQPFNVGEFRASFHGKQPDALSAEVLSQRGITHAGVIEKIFDTASDGELSKEHQLLLRHLSTVAASALPADADPLIASRFSTLTRPWTELRSILKPENLDRRLLPPPTPRKCFQEVFGTSAPYSQAQRSIPTLRKHRLLIDWAVRADKIEKALLDWARAARQKVVGGIARPGGHQPRAVLLKFLAAYRFREADYGFKECQDLIKSHRNQTEKLESPLLVLPVYKLKGKWEDAALKAERILSGNFPREIRGYFGYPLIEW